MNTKGFTLVELLAVIVVLAIISGLAIVGLTGVVNQGKIGMYKTSTTALKSAAQNYLVDNIDAVTLKEGSSINVSYNVLKENGYLNDDNLDVSSDNDCSNSYVTITKNASTTRFNFDYKACLICKNGDDVVYSTDNCSTSVVAGDIYGENAYGPTFDLYEGETLVDNTKIVREYQNATDLVFTVRNINPIEGEVKSVRYSFEKFGSDKIYNDYNDKIEKNINEPGEWSLIIEVTNTNNIKTTKKYQISYFKFIDKPSASSCIYNTYDGTSKILINPIDGVTLSNNNQTNAGTYTVTGYLAPNYSFKDGSTDSIKITCKIEKRNLTITAKDQTVLYGNSISKSVNDITSNNLINEHSITSITLTQSTTSVTTSGTITPSKAVIKSGSTEVTNNYNISYINGNLIINSPKPSASLGTVSGYSGTYDGYSHTITVSSYSGGTIYYATSSDKSTWGDWTTTRPYRTNAGTTYVRVYVKGDASHSDSETKTVSISISKASSYVNLSSNSCYSGSYCYIGVSSYSGGTLYYQTSSDKSSWSGWTTTKPYRTTAGTTYVKAYVSGDNNHYSSSVTSSYTISVTDYVAPTPTYYSQESKLIVSDATYEFVDYSTCRTISVSYSGSGTLYYKYNDSSWFTGNPPCISSTGSLKISVYAGSYCDSSTCYNATSSRTATVTVVPPTPTCTTTNDSMTIKGSSSLLSDSKSALGTVQGSVTTSTSGASCSASGSTIYCSGTGSATTISSKADCKIATGQTDNSKVIYYTKHGHYCYVRAGKSPSNSSYSCGSLSSPLYNNYNKSGNNENHCPGNGTAKDGTKFTSQYCKYSGEGCLSAGKDGSSCACFKPTSYTSIYSTTIYYSYCYT